MLPLAATVFPVMASGKETDDKLTEFATATLNKLAPPMNPFKLVLPTPQELSLLKQTAPVWLAFTETVVNEGTPNICPGTGVAGVTVPLKSWVFMLWLLVKRLAMPEPLTVVVVVAFSVAGAGVGMRLMSVAPSVSFSVHVRCTLFNVPRLLLKPLKFNVVEPFSVLKLNVWIWAPVRIGPAMAGMEDNNPVAMTVASKNLFFFMTKSRGVE